VSFFVIMAPFTWNCSADHVATQTIGHSSIDITAIAQYVTHSGPEVLFKTCVTMKFVDDDDGDDDDGLKTF